LDVSTSGFSYPTWKPDAADGRPPPVVLPAFCDKPVRPVRFRALAHGSAKDGHFFGMDVPETRYARSGDVSIAYQVFGEGPFDVVFAPSLVTHVELQWKVRPWAEFNERLGRLGRLIVFDKRGTGMSDRAVGIPDIEQRTDDIRAVMDAAGPEQAALIGTSDGGTMCALFAATYPERCWSLILWGSVPRYRFAPDYRGGVTEEELQASEGYHAEHPWGEQQAMEEFAEWLLPGGTRSTARRW
jgi:pimeloyl-ACP methyl ester carboxylesterase